MRPFANEPVLELRRAAVRSRLAPALAALDARLPLRVPVWVGPDRRHGDDLVSTDPGDPARPIAVAAAATPAEVDAALARAERGAREWSRTPAETRANALLRTAAWLRARRLEAAALAVRECAKPWPEADADVCEAIDFLEYYAREGLAVAAGEKLLQVPGERNELRWAARGVVAVISPWNFPLAIPCGMVAAALATGNAAVLKPAEQSPGCALLLCTALREAGVPSDAISLLPGEGDVGAALVRDQRVHVIAFTGSSRVGLEIWRAAAETPPGQKHLKRVVSEMGGKNCVIVDSDADLDEAVPALVRSAFGYAGQKCSAAARVLCHESVHDVLVERLAGAVRELRMGAADDLATDVPPVIERSARDRVAAHVEAARRRGRVITGDPGPGDGWYVAPAIATDLPEDSALRHEEVFGPVLAVEAVCDVAEACDLVDASPFGLTGGLFSRSPEVVAYVVGRSPVGNLYVNRAITGAMVARQPFGGNRLSGTGTKAGGPGYVLQFVEARAVTEKTVRHGLVV
jgi:RHH-type proline utilization regulon transcriptional repressor/proline dehydrogenase/delta 1-pyrroline-5-carboxylate dehydrogenase